MVAKTISSNSSFGYSSHCQLSHDRASPSDAAIIISASNMPASTSNKKASSFTRAHSLEIPDVDGDGDFPMIDLDQETPNILDICVSDDLWPQDLPNESEDSFARNSAFSSTAVLLDTTAKTTREAKLDKPKRVKRLTPKQKIDALHDKVNELAAHLQELKVEASRQKKLAAQRKLRDLMRPTRSQLWKQIAKRQLEQRQQSEEENLKLRQMMGMQVQEARNLRRVLKRRTKLEMLEDMIRMQCHKSGTDAGVNASVVKEEGQVYQQIPSGIFSTGLEHKGINASLGCVYTKHTDPRCLQGVF
ncbi:hypothetical protein F441_04693 [Phytophthora nicotianae CJ01A1]|uniref:Uncharacterized protein n=5 Tax=Phytophthora nicotianae TaxID=4792 RepID=W2QJC3_PHYN3|nr:hypothetical protein PPTG_08990 [Phytophthora nicotianae INRA-310]ETL45344.1 hypothetical protein L916_04544 [Phytophthora nicotianae]ETO80842.1 hypothetical protein F444_04742 [Phytophthora nicotianae P1976]ETP21883.1 hypothetical protein F441_04693 [Phytophthora nicotianae CJ01A1]ETP49805.1 hypothetical protein F442_04758 [Phytophthora nicotianae P10297]KUF64773.1 hypothetical protein AM587_10016423 [Phytophthora nicotianae]